MEWTFCLYESYKDPWPYISKYYNHASCSSLLQLYKSLVLPHLEYASAIWSPFLLGKKRFALRMCTKCWGGHYDHLLICHHFRGKERFHVCVFFSRLSMAYAILISTVFSPLVVLTPITHHIISLWFILSHTQIHSFVPATFGLWNHLDKDTVLSPSFKYKFDFVNIINFVWRSWSYIAVYFQQNTIFLEKILDP